jgi:sialate O-acetylesterase
MLGKEVLLELGRIVDADSVFVNGQFVGQTSYQYPPRRYPLPANVLKSGENTVLVRLISSGSAPAFVADKRYELTTSQDTVSLLGEWKYTQTVVANAIPAQTTVRWKPAGLYNAMIAPLLPMGLKAVLWYQGESNVGAAAQYGDLLQGLVHDWRKQFNQPNLPVLVAQLPNFLATNAQPTESDWAVLRSQQMRVLDLPNTGVTNNIDLGEWNDIHPEDKLSVANRFARLAYAVVYKEAIVNPSGPICTQAKKIGENVLLTFSNAQGGLQLSDKRAIRQVAIAGADRKFSWASADILGNQVRVWNNPGMEIKYVRFAWADNPISVNLTNKEGIPAFPFEMEVE